MSNCGLCFNKYDLEKHIPRILTNCRHVVCDACLGQILTADQLVIKCPHCNLYNLVPPSNEFSIHYKILGLVDDKSVPNDMSVFTRDTATNDLSDLIASAPATIISCVETANVPNEITDGDTDADTDVISSEMANIDGVTSSATTTSTHGDDANNVNMDMVCQYCQNVPPEIICYQCKIYVCQNCFDIIHKIGEPAMHKAESYVLGMNFSQACPKRGHSKFDRVCVQEDCQMSGKVICEFCQQNDHPDHQVVSLKKFLDKEKSTLREKIKLLKEQKEVYIKMNEEAAKMMSHLSTIDEVYPVSNIICAVDRTVRQMELFKNILIMYFKKRIFIEIKKLESFSSELITNTVNKTHLITEGEKLENEPDLEFTKKISSYYEQICLELHKTFDPTFFDGVIEKNRVVVVTIDKIDWKFVNHVNGKETCMIFDEGTVRTCIRNNILKIKIEPKKTGVLIIKCLEPGPSSHVLTFHYDVKKFVTKKLSLINHQFYMISYE